MFREANSCGLHEKKPNKSNLWLYLGHECRGNQMSKLDRQIANLSDRALEMIMRDVLDGLDEWSLKSTYQGRGCAFEVTDLQPVRTRRQANDRTRTAANRGTTSESGYGEIIRFRPKCRA